MSITIAIAPIAPAALNELKAWLRIENNDEDALLFGQLRAAFDMARQFTGQQLILSDVSEIVPVISEWIRLAAKPVSDISTATGIGEGNGEVVLGPDDWQADIDHDARGWVRVTRPGTAKKLRVNYRAGMAASWHKLPEAIRQGVIRYAAHGYSARESAESAPPAVVTALWHPWRGINL